jgi:anti-anti-sigma regulatory factor
VVVDISIVTDLTPGLLGVLIRAQRSVSWRNGRLVLVCEKVALLERLSSTGLTDVFDLLAPDDLPCLVQGGVPKEADSAA